MEKQNEPKTGLAKARWRIALGTCVVRSIVLTVLILTGLTASTWAQEVSIPDPGLNAAIRDVLQKPTGPLTQQDMLSLTNLIASSRDVASIDGLEAASNLTVLGLFNNHLTNFTLPNGLTNLTVLNLGLNSITQCSLPGGLTKLDTLFLGGNELSDFTLPAGMTRLTKLDLSANGLTSVMIPADATNLVNVLIFANQLTNV